MQAVKRSLIGVAMSAVELIIGILLLVNPVGFTSGIIVAFGIALMLWGLGNVILYFTTAPEQAAVSRMLMKGLVQFLGGAFCAFCSRWFLAVFPMLTLVYGIAILVTGITKLQWTVDVLRMKRSRWALTAISAAVSLLCGAVIVANPFQTTAVIWMFTGASLILEAVFDAVSAFFGNREKKTAEDDGEVAS